MREFRAAPWSDGLKATSFFGLLILAAAGYAALHAMPHGTRDTVAAVLGTLVAWVAPAIFAFALLFVVRGYALAPGELSVRRLAWSTRIPLAGLRDARADPQAMRRSLRVFGNGGLFSITGLYQSKSLGRYRAFVTDPQRAVVLELPGRTVVVSPEDTRAFVESLKELC